MFDLILENKAGDQLTFGMNGPFTVTEIQGLNPPVATINTNEIAVMDGALYNSAKVNMRTLNIAFAIEYSAAYYRIEVFNVLKSKQWVRMYYKSDYRDVYIDGYIQSIDISYFEKKQIVTCTILCPSPFFKNAQEVIDELSNIIPMFHFPFASTETPELLFSYLDPVANVDVINTGDVETGLIFELYAYGTVGNIKIYDHVTGEYIGTNFEMEARDLITIDTRQGEKTITLTRDGIKSNIFNSLMKGSTWLQLPASGGVYTFEVGVGEATNLHIDIKHFTLYEGV